MNNKILAIFFSLLISLDAYADDFEFFVSTSFSRFHYDWYGASEATFKMNLPTAGFGFEHSSGFGVNTAFGRTEKARTNVESRHYGDFAIPLDRYVAYEVYYKHKLNNSYSLYGGLGHYKQRVPIYWLPTGEIAKQDSDDDSGFFGGVEYRYKSISISAFLKQTSRIGKGRGKSTTKALGSTMRQYGIEARLYF